MTVLTQNFDLLQSRVAGHIAADELIQGEYWKGGQGCFIGCTVHSERTSEAWKLFGITEPIMRIAANIFEELPIDEAKAFFAAFPAAVECDGKDLSRVHWQFFAAELRALPEQRAEIQTAIFDPVIEGMDLLAAGEEWHNLADAEYRVTYAALLARADRSSTLSDRKAVLAVRAADAAADAAADGARHVVAFSAFAVADRAADAAADYSKARLRQRNTLLRLIKEAPVPEPKP